MKVADHRDGESLIQDTGDEGLAKVDDSVLELTIASWSVTRAPSLVIVRLVRRAHAEIAHVLTAALHADFQVCVAVELT